MEQIINLMTFFLYWSVNYGQNNKKESLLEQIDDKVMVNKEGLTQIVNIITHGKNEFMIT